MLGKMLMRISKRERTMVILLVLVLLLLWLGQMIEGWDKVHRELSENRREISLQEVWIKNADSFDQQLNTLLQQVDGSKTLDAPSLSAFIDHLARQGNLTYELSSPTVTEGPLFRQNNVRVILRNLNLQQLLRVYRAIVERKPYLSIEEISMTANRSDPRLLNVRMIVSSFELKDPNQSTP